MVVIGSANVRILATNYLYSLIINSLFFLSFADLVIGKLFESAGSQMITSLVQLITFVIMLNF